MMASGFSGLQHLASLIIRLSTPSISTSIEEMRCAAGLWATGRGMAAGFAVTSCWMARPARGEFVAPERGEQFFQLVEMQALRDLLLIDRGYAEALQFAFEQQPALRDAVVEVLRLEPVPHLGARTRALQVAELRAEPVAARCALFCGEDFHALPVLQFIFERHDAAIHFGATGAVAEVGVQGDRKS